MSRVATSTDETPKPACFLSRNLRLAGSAVLLCLWWGSLHKALQLDLRSTSLHGISRPGLFMTSPSAAIP